MSEPIYDIVKIPSIVETDQEIEFVLEQRLINDGAIEDLRRSLETSVGLKARSYLAILYCMNSEYKNAWNLLENISDGDLSDAQRIAFHRLRGTVATSREDFATAESEFKQVKDLVKEPAPWLKRDIAVDLRNLAIAKFNAGKAPRDEVKEWAQRVEEQSSWYFHPPIDHALTEAAEKLEDESFALATKQPGTIRFGGNFGDAIKSLNSALVAAYKTGSLAYSTHVKQRIAKCLFAYGSIYRDPNLLLQAIRAFIQNGDWRSIQEFLRIYRDDVVSATERVIPLIDYPIEIGETTASKNCKAILIRYLADYVPDKSAGDYLDFLIGNVGGEEPQHDLKRNCASAFASFGQRGITDQRLRRLIPLMKGQHPSFTDELFRSMRTFDWNEFGDNISSEIAQIVFDGRGELLNRSHAYAILTVLGKSHPTVWDKYDPVLINEFESKPNLDIVWYFSLELHKGAKPFLGKLLDYLVTLVNQEDSEAKPKGGIGLGGYSITGLISNFFLSYGEWIASKSTKDVLNVYQNYLRNHFQVPTRKQRCLDSVISILSFGRKFPIKDWRNFLKNEVKDILTCREEKGIPFSPIFGKRAAVELALLRLRVMLGTPITEEDFGICLEHSSDLDEDIRNGAVDCLVAFAKRYPRKYLRDVSLRLYDMTFDSWYVNRAKAIIATTRLPELPMGMHTLWFRRFEDLSHDYRTYVRYQAYIALGEVAKLFVLDGLQDLIRIVGRGKEDRSFIVRKHASIAANKIKELESSRTEEK